MFQVAIRNPYTSETRIYYGTAVDIRPATWGNGMEVWITPEPKERVFPHRNDEAHVYRTLDPIYIETGDIWYGTWYNLTNLPDEYWHNKISLELITKLEDERPVGY